MYSAIFQLSLGYIAVQGQNYNWRKTKRKKHIIQSHYSFQMNLFSLYNIQLTLIVQIATLLLDLSQLY